jgi:hypothetical protein
MPITGTYRNSFFLHKCIIIHYYTKSHFKLSKLLLERALWQSFPDGQWLIDNGIWYYAVKARTIVVSN